MTRAVAGWALVAAVALAACSGAPVASPPTALTVPDANGVTMALEILDETGQLVDARALRQKELDAASRPLNDINAIIAAPGSTSSEVLVAWVSLGCETSGRLSISEPNLVRLVNESTEACDFVPGALGASYRAVALVFRGPVNVQALQLDMQPFKFGEKG